MYKICKDVCCDYNSIHREINKRQTCIWRKSRREFTKMKSNCFNDGLRENTIFTLFFYLF